jgi:endo-beta-N-acetylglucosaminidase D
MARYRSWETACLAVLLAVCGGGPAGAREAAPAAPRAAQGSPPGQPFASYWYPATLLTWDPASDPDVPFNRSHVPLAPRFADPALAVNPHARGDEARISSLVAFAPTSGNPSQGSPTMDYYALNYWQYLDTLVFWGGSAGEGLILAPNSTVIDAAHRNGVPVLGNIFFPPNVYGGDIQWVYDLVQQDVPGHFPVADKLIEVAQLYGFDGWFVNQETSGGDAVLAQDLRDFMAYIQASSNLKIVWYDAMIENGAIAWQNQLDSNNDLFFEDGEVISDDMFLNFNWSAGGLDSSRTLARSLGRSEYELYAGVDVEANGYNTSVNWTGVFPESQPHVTSLGFYRPEWTFNGAADAHSFYVRDNRFWVGANRDPSNTTTNSPWKGLAHYVPATSPISSLPFVTRFDTGQGDRYAVDGQVVAVGGWNNLSDQDVLPTWRWIVRGPGTHLFPDLDWSTAWWGGTSLSVTGTLDAENTLDLYETHLDVTPDTVLAVTYETGAQGPTEMAVALTYQDDPSNPVLYDVGDAPTTGWNTRTFDLGTESGRRVDVVALRFAPDGPPHDYAIHVGALGIYDAPVAAPAPPADFAVDGKIEIDPATATLRLSWTASTDPVRTYDVYRRNPDDTLTFLGTTLNDHWFVAEVDRVGREDVVTLELEAVSPELGRSTPVTTTFAWDVPLDIFDDGFESGDTTSWSQVVP